LNCKATLLNFRSLLAIDRRTEETLYSATHIATFSDIAIT